MFNRQAPQPTIYSLEKLMDDFGSAQHFERGNAQTTIANYHHYLRRFLDFAGDIDPSEITRPLVRSYREHLATLGISRATQNYHLIALRSFVRYLRREGINTIPVEMIDVPKVARAQVAVLTKDELNCMLNVIDTDTLTGLRDRAILELIYSAGLRVSEAMSLNRDQLVDGAITLMGKGQKIRTTYYTPRAGEWVAKYLAERDDDNPALFVDIRDKARLHPKHVQRLVKDCATLANIGKNVTPHTLRHTFATQLLGNKADIRFVQELLGHASITTTQMYTHVTNAQLRDIHKKYLV